MDYEKIEQEMLPFLEEGKITKKTELLWLQFRGVIRIAQNGEVLVKPDKDTDKLSAKQYQNHLDFFEQFMREKRNRELGQIGTEPKKVLTSNEINPEDIPF